MTDTSTPEYGYYRVDDEFYPCEINDYDGDLTLIRTPGDTDISGEEGSWWVDSDNVLVELSEVKND